MTNIVRATMRLESIEDANYFCERIDLDERFQVDSSMRGGKPWDPFASYTFGETLKEDGVSTEGGSLRVLDAHVTHNQKTLWIHGTVGWAPARWGFELYPTLRNLMWKENVALSLAAPVKAGAQQIAFARAGITLEAGSILRFGDRRFVRLKGMLSVNDDMAWIEPAEADIAAGQVTVVPNLGYAKLTGQILALQYQDRNVYPQHPGVIVEGQPLVAAPKAAEPYLVLPEETFRRMLSSSQARFVVCPDSALQAVVFNEPMTPTIYIKAEDGPAAKRLAARVLLGEL